MADDELEDEDLDEVEEGEEGEEGEPSKGGKKKLLLIIILVVLLLVGAGAAAFFTGLLDPLLGGGAETAETGGGESKGGSNPKAPAVFMELPEMLVNLNTGGRSATLLKIRVSLELERSEDIPKIQAVIDRVIDNFQVYLRELRIDDLRGSAGMYRLREELLTRVQVAVHPTQVNAVLFKEMLVQ